MLTYLMTPLGYAENLHLFKPQSKGCEWQILELSTNVQKPFVKLSACPKEILFNENTAILYTEKGKGRIVTSDGKIQSFDISQFIQKKNSYIGFGLYSGQLAGVVVQQVDDTERYENYFDSSYVGAYTVQAYSLSDTKELLSPKTVWLATQSSSPEHISSDLSLELYFQEDIFDREENYSTISGPQERLPSDDYSSVKLFIEGFTRLYSEAKLYVGEPYLQTILKKNRNTIPPAAQKFAKKNKKLFLDTCEENYYSRDNFDTVKAWAFLGGEDEEGMYVPDDGFQAWITKDIQVFAYLKTEEACEGHTTSFIGPILVCRYGACETVDTPDRFQISDRTIDNRTYLLARDDHGLYIQDQQTKKSVLLSNDHFVLVSEFNPDLKEEAPLNDIYHYQKAKPKGKLHVATGKKYLPMFDLTGDSPTGFDVELAQEIARRLGLDGVEFVNSKSSRMSAKNNKVDFAMAAISVTESRLQSHLFSKPYFKTTQVIVGTKTTPIFLDKLSTLNCGYHSPIYKSALKKQGCNMKYFSDTASVLNALENGAIDYTILEQPSIPPNMKSYGLINTDSYGIVFPNDAFVLKMRIDDILFSMQEDGTMKNLKQRYGLE